MDPEGLMRLARTPIAALVILLAAGLPSTAQDDQAEVRALRDVRGSIVEVRSAPDQDGTIWLDLLIQAEKGERLTIRLAPSVTITEAAFRVNVGDVVRVRFFTEPEPYPVQKIRNETTRGQLRLRCLHGEPLWGSHSHGHGPGGHRYRGSRSRS